MINLPPQSHHEVCLVVIFILAVIIYRTLAAVWLFKDPATRNFASILASMSGAFVSAKHI